MRTIRSRCIAVFFLASLLAGCATTNEKGLLAYNAGNLHIAEMRFTEAAQEGEPVGWSNLGLVYERTGRREQAIQAYKLGARYGVSHAQQQLIRLGEDVPPADLVRQQQSGSSGWADALAIGLGGAAAYQNGLNSVPRQPSQPAAVQAPKTTCSSKWDDFTKTLRTVCQ